MAWLGVAGPGEARQGAAGRGKARQGEAGLGVARQGKVFIVLRQLARAILEQARP
jgi:hypothetical protein